MKEQLITFDTAKLAKEKGFDEITDLVYNTYYDEVLQNFNSLKHSDGDNPIISAPTQALLQKWLRKVHNIHIIALDSRENKGLVYIYRLRYIAKNTENLFVRHINVKTYEKALEKGLQEALKLIL